MLMLQPDTQEAQLLLGDLATRKPAKDCWNHWNGVNILYIWTSKWQTKSGTNRKLVYDFLLVLCSHFCRITHRAPFTRNLMWNSLMTLKYRQGHRQSHQLKAIVWPCMQNVRKTVNEWSENRYFQRPHSHLTPPPMGTPASICINLILPETMFPGLHFCRWQYMGSSAHFRTVLTESRRRQPISCQARNIF